MRKDKEVLMALYQPHDFTIPEDTAQVARAAFPKGNAYMTVREELGPLFQDKAGQGFGVHCFRIDWHAQTVTGPQGRHSQSWHTRREEYGHEHIAADFAPADCVVCAHQADCTRSKRGTRTVSFKPQLEYETLQAARERQETTTFKEKYNKRAGIEGTISQGTRAFDLRRTRYIELVKTHLQHLAWPPLRRSI